MPEIVARDETEERVCQQRVDHPKLIASTNSKTLPSVFIGEALQILVCLPVAQTTNHRDA